MSDLPKVTHRLKADDENMERMHTAARKGLTEEVRRLMEIGVDPAITNRFGCTAIHLACKFGQVDTAKYLAGVCDVQSAWHGQKPLHLAVLSNKLNLVEALITGAKERGKPIDNLLNDCDEMEVTQVGDHYKQCKGQTALHWCVGLGPAYMPMLKLLLSHGASPTAKDKDGETPLMRAVEFRNDEAVTAMLELTSPQQLRLDYQDKEGRSHLHWVIMYNHEDYALRFIELGHDMNMEDNEHTVPLYLAIRAGMVALTTQLLEEGDPFLVQNAPFHNGRDVFPDRIKWLDFVEDEQAKVSVINLLQKKLDEIISSLNTDSTAPKRKKRASVKKMNLAPSAPYRTQGKSVPRKSITKK